MPQGGTRVPLTVSSRLARLFLEAQQRDDLSPGEPPVPAYPEPFGCGIFRWESIRFMNRAADEPISFAELRALADSHDITRLAIETARISWKSSIGRSNRE